jgi:hypothetical protein
MFNSRICEYYSNKLQKNSDIAIYNRCVGIEIRGISPVSHKKKCDLLKYYEGKLYNIEIPVFTENAEIIKKLDSIAMREEIPIHIDNNYPIQMIVFCPVINLCRLLENNLWITRTIIINTNSLYLYGMSMNVRYIIFYNIEQLIHKHYND